MAEQFYTIPTAIGKAKIANSIALGAKVNLKTMKIGDSNGIYYNPSESQTDLVHTVYSCEINSIEIDESNSNWINVVCAIPADVGDFFIREVGIFDDNNDLIAIGKYPETYKPLASNGSTKELYIKMTFEVTNVSSVTLKIDPTVILATKNDINILTNSISSINAQMSELANQYEEGTFTPYITGATNSGTFVPVYSAQNGSFIRQNKLITFKLKVVLLSYTGAFNGNLRIAGLPFAAVSDGVNIPLSVSDLNNLDMDTNAKFATAQVMNSSSAIALLQPTDNSSGISVANTNLGQTFAITITGQYKKA
ncbi:hypothetical protein B0H39_003794 [Clostridium beijerinckii]|uniref:phage tail protein n=1 Tax=Clostridium beijerinckii TaxID=1520 RepID=UPI00149477BD|nr:phage tail protein [Clostridium beijerinckii]NOW85913.1 hypothetical protein [Clostridium beijerinckii]